MFTVRTVSDVLPDVPAVRRALDDAEIDYVEVMLEADGVSVVCAGDPRVDAMLESQVRRLVLQAITRRRELLDPASGPVLARLASLETANAALGVQLEEILALLRARK